METTNGMPHTTWLHLVELRKTLLAKFPAFVFTRSSHGVIKANERMRTTLGRAFLKTFEIHLNSRAVLHDDAELENTFAHELAHLAAVEMFGPNGHGHGRMWKHVMRQFGYKPERCGNNAVARSLRRPQKTKGFIACGCGINHPFKTSAWKKLLQGAIYRCRRCSRNLELERLTQ